MSKVMIKVETENTMTVGALVAFLSDLPEHFEIQFPDGAGLVSACVFLGENTVYISDERIDE